MARKGGQTTFSGTRFQAEITVLYLGRLLDLRPRNKEDQVIEVRPEADVEAKVDDILVRFQDGHAEYIQAKEKLSKSKGETSAWVKMWKHFRDQRQQADFREDDRIILALGQPQAWTDDLRSACEEASESARDTREWHDKWLTQSQTTLVDDVRKILYEQDPKEVQDEQLLALFGSITVRMYDPERIRADHAPHFMPESDRDWGGLYDLLLRVVLESAEKGKAIDSAWLMEKLSKEGVVIYTPTEQPVSTQRIDIDGGLYSATFVGRDNTEIHYGYSAEQVERLIEKAVSLLQSGANFIPLEQQVILEGSGEQLIFQGQAAQRLQNQANERAYLLGLTLQQDYRIWATRFIPLKAQVDVRRNPVGLDIPVAYSELRLPQPGAGPEAQITREPLEDITQALDKHPAFVILGEPGAGKTTALQKIAYERSISILSGSQQRVPLFIRLSEQGEREPLEFVQSRWQEHTGTPLRPALATGRVLLLLDGINELPRHDRDERLKLWGQAAREWSNLNQVVFTGREKDYEGQLNLPRVLVEELDDPRIGNYLQQSQAEGLEKLLDEPGTNLRQMARNPLYLSLLVYAYRKGVEHLANRGWLLGWFVDNLCERERLKPGQSWLQQDVLRSALAALAFHIQTQGESLTLPVKEARLALPGRVEHRGEDIELNSSELFRFARGAAILDPNSEPDVRFYHHLLQEYFAALEFLRRFQQGEDLSQLWAAPRRQDEMPEAAVGLWDPLPEPPSTGWEMTTLLACGLSAEPERLVEALRPGNPALAGRCLAESGMASEGSEQALQGVRQDLLADLYDPEIHLRARLQAGYLLGRLGDPRFIPQEIKGVKVILPTMVPVPAGRYRIGSQPDDEDAFESERPATWVELPEFALGKWPVTNAEYACFMAAGGYENEEYWVGEMARRWLKGEEVAGGQYQTWLDVWKTLKSMPDVRSVLEQSGSFSPEQIKTYLWVAGRSEEELKAWLDESLQHKSRRQPAYWDDPQYNNPSQPVVGVTWFEAQAYCAWLIALCGKTFRLPSEAEWEAAGRGSTASANRIYPWGAGWEPARANTIEGRVLKPSPVGAYAAAGGVGPYGAEDQAGNVWNWTSSLYRPYPYDPGQSEQPEAQGERVLRGGSWVSLRRLARCASRGRLVPDYFFGNGGFRVLSPGILPDSGC